MTTVRWAAALDAFEARIDAQAEALARHDAEPVAPFEPPDLPAPLPAELVERAAALVWRCRELEDKLSAAVSDARAALQDAHAKSTARPHNQPVYFDSRV